MDLVRTRSTSAGANAGARTMSASSSKACGKAGVVALTLTTEASYPEPASSRAPSASTAAAISGALSRALP